MSINKEKDTLVVNLFGGPGIGKSTLASGIFTLLKLADVDCELVPEYAKDLVWEERHKTFLDQQYIFGKQNHRLWRVNNRVDVVITDCPLLLSAIYGDINGTGSPEFNRNVVKVMEGYNNLNILITRSNEYNPNGRNQTKAQAIEVDTIVKDNLIKYNQEWHEVPRSSKGINKVAKMILDGLDIEFKFKLIEED
jgi:hypothetical protein